MSLRSANARKSTTRLDILTMMMNAGNNAGKMENHSPCDSLSPLETIGRDDQHRKNVRISRAASQSSASSKQTIATGSDHNSQATIAVEVLAAPLVVPEGTLSAGSSSSPAAGTREDLHVTFLDCEHKSATPAQPTCVQEACSPRSPHITRPRRPTSLKLTQSNGLTLVSTSDLRLQIRGDGHTASTCATQLSELKLPTTRTPLPKTPAVIAMGNAQSNEHGETAGADSASLVSVVRKPMFVLRKSSTNLFKRIDSKSPLPRPLTATSILVTEVRKPDDDESPIDPFRDPAFLAREPVILHSSSTMTVTDESTIPSLSASTAVSESRKESQSPYQATVDDADSDSDEPPTVPTHRSSALSPTLPAPSRLPEDSPHKYGLKDRMDTPELMKEPQPDINAMKARRRSSGLEIFNEAKSLQSAQSFLNGLSTSRRRAESRTCTSDTWQTNFTTSTSRPSSRPPSSRATSAIHIHNTNNNGTGRQNTSHDMHSGRKRGHNFKATGFAYSRNLTFSQLKCYQSHSRLLRSKNKTAPVECAVCHMDDDQEHFTCSWCAMRMCRYCRNAFGEGGVTALRARIRDAETGDSPASSMESLPQGRGRSRAVAYN